MASNSNPLRNVKINLSSATAPKIINNIQPQQFIKTGSLLQSAIEQAKKIDQTPQQEVAPTSRGASVQ